ncbi:MAG TPA: N-formylglutamate deformylase [Steroidobacteraceae bacterium]|jgi:N-formylglutamate deformylase|nr:N-formylglutamate deformylase [Steroidobacteraceae bacterium]
MAKSARVPIFGYDAGTSPLLISFPHSGTYVPPDIAARLAPAALDLPDTDWFVPELYHFAREAGASVIRATHTRYVVDLNRPPDGKPLYPGQRETTVCPVETFDGETLYKPGTAPAPGEVAARLGMYWRPYHDQLAALTREIAARHGRCILWDAHSIHSVVPGLFEGRLPDLNVGTSSGKSCSPALLERVIAPLKAQSRFSFVVDGRFKGGYITRHYGNPAARIEAVQMEIAQCAYVAERRVPVYDGERAQPLGALLQQVIESLAEP